eukprot:TRINITY_DN9738_c0_g1_i4.p1 TRINITY_DN9738_c0_g1~~TRINITY_DN9738_c0_g1_i4.p1  ORF type:complete len:518 (+),score=75.75 TRINITY_DN9738_c0_g1_i4:155-1708(+)
MYSDAQQRSSHLWDSIASHLLCQSMLLEEANNGTLLEISLPQLTESWHLLLLPNPVQLLRIMLTRFSLQSSIDNAVPWFKAFFLQCDAVYFDVRLWLGAITFRTLRTIDPSVILDYLNKEFEICDGAKFQQYVYLLGEEPGLVMRRSKQFNYSGQTSLDMAISQVMPFLGTMEIVGLTSVCHQFSKTIKKSGWLWRHVDISGVRHIGFLNRLAPLSSEMRILKLSRCAVSFNDLMVVLDCPLLAEARIEFCFDESRSPPFCRKLDASSLRILSLRGFEFRHSGSGVLFHFFSSLNAPGLKVLNVSQCVWMDDNLFQIICRNCSSIEELLVNECHVTSDGFRSSFRFQLLRSFQCNASGVLQDMDQRVGLDQDALHSLVENNPALQSLGLSMNLGIENDGFVSAISLLHDLVCLDLSFMEQLRKSSLLALFNSCRKLQVLNLNRVQSLDDECVESMCTSCPDMEEVNFRFCQDVSERGIRSMLGNLAKLKSVVCFVIRKADFEALRSCGVVIIADHIV